MQRLPPPKGDEKAPLKALLVDSWYDAYLGVVVLVRVVDGVLKKGMTIKMMGTGAAYDVDRVGVFRPKMTEVGRARPRRGRLPHRLHQGGRRHARRRHHHRRPAADADRPARLQAGAAGGVLRPLPGRRRRVRESARRHGQAPPQRRQLLLRDGDERRPRLRLPLRLPRAPAPRDHPGASRARVQPRPHLDGAERRLQDPSQRRPHDRVAQPGRHAGRDEDRIDRGAVDPRHHPDAGRVSRRRS